MTQPTFEEAKVCPKCGKPGEDTSSIAAPGLPRGTRVHTIFCRTELCRWHNTCWYVQVNPDGSVPVAKNHSGEPKLYAGFEGHDDRAKDIIAGLKAQAEAETEPGAEVRNPFSR